jgi:hypothetical protein
MVSSHRPELPIERERRFSFPSCYHTASFKIESRVPGIEQKDDIPVNRVIITKINTESPTTVKRV